MGKRLIGALAGLLLVLALVAAWTAFGVKGDLAAAAKHATALKVAVQGGDQRAARAELSGLQDSATSAREGTDGPVFAVLGWLPGIGDDAAGVRTISATLDDLAQHAIDPLVGAAAKLDAGSFAPDHGRLPVGAIASLRRPITAGATGFAEAEANLGQVDSGGFLPSLRTPFNDLRRTVRDSAASLHAAQTAVDVLPGMLGRSGTRHYLLVVQNNAEVRATGGLPGAVSVLEARDGRVRLTRQMAGSAFPELKQPILPLTKEELALYDRQLGTYFVDANFTPDFPRAAELWRARWQRDVGGKIDGVLSVDPVALSYLLKATGPVEAPGGVTLTADDAVRELLNRVYVRNRDPKAQDAWFAAVAQLIFNRVSTGVQDPKALMQGLARGASEHRIEVHSFDAREQDALSGTAVAGELVTKASNRPQVGVYLNSGAASKMNYYLRYRANVHPTWCKAGVQELEGSMTLHAEKPADLATLPAYITGGTSLGKLGTQLVIAQIYGPVGGSLKDLTFDGEPAQVDDIKRHDGRPVYTAAVFLEPGQSSDVTWRMRTGRGQTGDADLSLTPDADARGVPFSGGTAC